MEPIEYLRAIRIRWKAVVAVVAVALVAGWVTTPDRASPARVISEFNATNTLQLAADSDDGTKLNLNSVAFLVTTGDVPTRAAEKLNYEGDPGAIERHEPGVLLVAGGSVAAIGRGSSCSRP